jgi:uncharacterized membrane protein
LEVEGKYPACKEDKETSMSKRNKTDRSRKLQAKKDAVMKTKKTASGKKRKASLVGYGLVAVVLAVAVAAASLWFFGSTSDTVAADRQGGAMDDATVVKLPVSRFEDGTARHFEYQHGNDTIRFFVLKSADGVVRAAFDACDVCWPAGKGYYQEGDNMVCRNCGRRFASNRINEIKGGCNPAPLRRSIVGEDLVIQVSDIIEGKAYFNYSGKA